MQLYVLKPIAVPFEDKGPWFNPWDCAHGFVVRARDEHEARLFAAAQAGDEGVSSWLLASISTCELLAADGIPGVVLRDFFSA